MPTKATHKNRAGAPARHRWRNAALTVGIAVTIVPLAAGCRGGASYSVGDCVRIERQTFDSDLKGADCGSAQGTFDATRRVYRVDSIIQNTKGGCPQLQGFFPVEFVDEPDGVTYCLVQAD